MRKGLLLLASVLGILNGNAVKAQSANMGITLLDALSFTINQPTFLADKATKQKDDYIFEAIASDHISVVSSRGYIVKAIFGQPSGSGPGIEGLVQVSSLIGTTNRGNTAGVILESDVILPPAEGSPVTVITASKCSWNGIFSTNKFNIAYKIGNRFANIDKNAAPSVIPVIFSVIQP